MKAKTLLILFLLSISFQSINSQSLFKPTEPTEVCMEAWNNYRKANTLWYTGWGLLSVGIPAVTAGTMTWLLTLLQMPYDQWTTQQKAVNGSGMALMCLGSGMVIASIPCISVGQVRRKRAMMVYAEWNCHPETCEDIKFNYQEANKLWKAGWGLLSAGAGLAIAGGVSAGCGGEMGWNVGWGIFGLGCGAIVSSVPCLAVGQVRRKAIRNTYNTQCADQPPLTFSFNTSSNGLGLALNF